MTRPDTAAGGAGERAPLRDGLAAAARALGLALDEPALRRLIDYVGLLQRWNRVYNLTALRETPQMLTHHLVDCLAVLPALQREAATLRPAGSALRVLDVGSGGGLPGVVLAIMRPDWTVTTVDAVAKKAGFVRQVASELGLGNLRAAHARVESLPPGSGHDVIVSRAFASLTDFVNLTRALRAPGGVWLAMKGRPPGDEQAALPPDIDAFHVEHIAVPGLDAQRCLVWLRPHAPASVPGPTGAAPPVGPGPEPASGDT